jgi:hypothetical protein
MCRRVWGGRCVIERECGCPGGDLVSEVQGDGEDFGSVLADGNSRAEVRLNSAILSVVLSYRHACRGQGTMVPRR